MQNCLNFIKEEKLLQTNACKMGQRRYHIIVGHTPKFHPKIYGEVVEYFWVYAKNYYRRLSLDKKKSKKISNNFLEAISRDNLTINRVCMFSRRAREYIIT